MIDNTKNEEFETILDTIDLSKPAPVDEPKRQYYFIKKARGYVKQMSEKAGRPLFSHVTTFGCQMNARDSEKLTGILEQILLFTTLVLSARMPIRGSMEESDS